MKNIVLYLLILASVPIYSFDNESFLKKSLPVFNEFYENYNIHYYMKLWCVRNSQNLYKKFLALDIASDADMYAVYLINKRERTSLTPETRRYITPNSWSNHAFLVVNNLVFDQDYLRQATIVSPHKYLSTMWQDEMTELIFQIRPASEIQEYTNYKIRESIANDEYYVTDFQGFLDFFHSSHE